jgi:hypothetical protein
MITGRTVIELMEEGLKGFDYSSRKDTTCKVCKKKYTSPAIANYCERRHESIEISPEFETIDEQLAWNKMTIKERMEWNERN